MAPMLSMLTTLAIGRPCPRGQRRRTVFVAATMSTLMASAAPNGSAHAPPIRIELRSEVEVSGASVKLGEVASVIAEDPALQRRLEALPLGAAPGAGAEVHLDRARLSRWIHARMGVVPEQVGWGGASASRVRRAARVLPGEIVAGEAVASLRAAIEHAGLRPEVSVHRAPRDLAIPSGRVEARPRPPSRADVLARRPTLWVEVSVDGRLARTVPVTLEARALGPGYVATRSRSVGESIEPFDLEVKELEWSGREPLPVGSMANQPFRLRRRIEAGAIVSRADVEPVPEVTQGDWATLHAHQGMVELESRVVALQDGRAGQTVRVRLPTASSSILARVTGPGAVEVTQ